MTSRICQIARKSMVIVADKNDESAYCSGCVIIKEDQAVVVITSLDFVDGRENDLKVVFYDREELNATVDVEQDAFCLLRTELHLGCEEIRLLENEDSLVPDTGFMFAPLSQTASQRLTTFFTVESLRSYELERDFVPRSTNYFLASIPYSIDRIIAAPVFTVEGKTAGIVLQCLRDEDEQPEAAELKIILKASHIYEMFFGP